MALSRIIGPLAAFMIGLGAAAVAQQPAAQESVKAKHGDWEVRCGTENGACYMNQIVVNEEGSPLVNVAVRRLVNNPQAKAIAVFVAPLGVVLPRGMEMRIDGGDAILSPFLYCLSNGCFAELAMTDEGLDRLRRGASATLQLYSVQEPNKAISRRLSLSGFTRAYSELN